MLKLIMVSLCLLLSINCFSQDNDEKDQEVDMVTYKVQLGETIRLISRKYFVTPSQIYKYNKFAIEGITEGMLLYIPVPKKSNAYAEIKETRVPKSKIKSATVDKKEIVVKEVSKDRMNQAISKAEEVLKTTNNPSSIDTNNINVVNNDDSNTLTHKVKSHETLFGLSKEYNITVDELKDQNQKLLKNGLQVGQVLTIKKNN